MTQQPQPPRTSPASAAPRSDQPSIGELINRISENISALVKSEIELLRAKALRTARTAGVGAALLTAAGIAALFGLGFLLGAIVDAIDEAMLKAGTRRRSPVWAAKIIVAVVLFAVAVAVALPGKRRLEAAKADAPDPKARLKDDVDAVREAVASGLEKGGQR